MASVLGSLGGMAAGAASSMMKDAASKAGEGFLKGALGETVGGAIGKGLGTSPTGAFIPGTESVPTGDLAKDTVNAIRDLQKDVNKHAGSMQQTNSILYANAELLGHVVGQQKLTNKLLNDLLKKDFSTPNKDLLSALGNMGGRGSALGALGTGAAGLATRALPVIGAGAVGGAAGNLFGAGVNEMLKPLKRMLGYTAENFPNMAKWSEAHSMHGYKAGYQQNSRDNQAPQLTYSARDMVFKATNITFVAENMIGGPGGKISAAALGAPGAARPGTTPGGGPGGETPQPGSGGAAGTTPDSTEPRTVRNAAYDSSVQTPSFGGIPGGKGAYQGFGADLSKQSMQQDLEQAGKFTQFGQGGALKAGTQLDQAAARGRPSPREFYNSLISNGASAKEAQMLTSAAMAESNMDPNATHDNGAGFGLFGHNLKRLDMRGKSWQEQGAAALKELRTSPHASVARRALEKAQTAEEITEAQMHYERPQDYTQENPRAGSNWKGRLANTQRLMGAPAESPEKVKEQKTKPSAARPSAEMLSNAPVTSIPAPSVPTPPARQEAAATPPSRPGETSHRHQAAAAAPLTPSRPGETSQRQEAAAAAPTPPEKPRFGGALENLTPRKVKTTAETPRDSSGATPPVPGDSRMSVVGRAAQRGTGDPRIRQILTEASKYLPEGYRAEIYSGLRPGDPRFHGRGMANDMRIIGPNGRPIENYQNPDNFRIYEKFAQNAKKIQMQTHPELERDFRWGGYFSGGKGKYGAMDLMHFDIGGKRVGMAGGSWEKGLTQSQKAIWGGAPVSQGMGDISRYSLPTIGKERMGETQDKSSVYKSPANPFGLPPQYKENADTGFGQGKGTVQAAPEQRQDRAPVPETPHKDKMSSADFLMNRAKQADAAPAMKNLPHFAADTGSMSDAANDIRKSAGRAGIPRSAAYRNAIENYYGKKISDREFEMLHRATHAETWMKTNPEETAMIMGSVLNRAKRDGSSIEDVLMKRSQFQSVTGKKGIGFNPSREYKEGPHGQRETEIQDSIISRLQHVPEGQTDFTSHVGKFKELGWHKQLEKRPEHAVHGRTMFGTTIKGGSYPGEAPSATRQEPQVTTGKHAADKSFSTMHHERPQQNIHHAVGEAIKHHMGDRGKERVKTSEVDRGYKDRSDLARLFGNRNFA